MSEKERITLMAQLAAYDQEFGEQDRKINGYFRHDYVYKKNMMIRFFVSIAGGILLLFYYASKIFIEQIDIFSMSFQQEVIRMIVFFGILLLGYSIIGTIKFDREYHIAQKRLERYRILVKKMEKSTDNTNEEIQGARNIDGKNVAY